MPLLLLLGSQRNGDLRSIGVVDSAGDGGERPAGGAELIWDIFVHNPMWGRHRIAMTPWALGVFISATTVRDILLRPRPEAPTPAPAQVKEAKKPRQIIARYPNHVWSVDRTRVWRWGVWPTWVLVAIDHFSRAVMAIARLEGPNAGWVVEVLEDAFLRCAPQILVSGADEYLRSTLLRAVRGPG